MTAVSVLEDVDGVDPARIGALGHSFGGHTVLFLAAIDGRVSFACVSGAAGSYEGRMERDIGIVVDHLVPGIERLDFDTLVALVAPRPLLLVAGTDDPYALDAAQIAERAASAYAREEATEALTCTVMAGGHALTSGRRETIHRWLATHAGLRP